MKICSKCKKNKNLEEFPRNKIKKDGRGNYCKECHRPIGRDNYKKHKDRYFKIAKQRDKELDKLINSYKDKPCMDCGIKYPPFVMDFDHIGIEKKEFNISSMRRRRMAFDKIIVEISKCEVVCSNCHRIRSNNRNPVRYMAL